jgi:hypothetical protein
MESTASNLLDTRAASSYRGVMAQSQDRRVRKLQPPGERQYEQNDKDDSPNPDSAIGAVRVISAATAE